MSNSDTYRRIQVLVRERDAATRMYARVVASERLSINHLLVIVAEMHAKIWPDDTSVQIARDWALAIYPYEILREIYGEYTYDEDDLTQQVRRAYQLLDEKFPAA